MAHGDDGAELRLGVEAVQQWSSNPEVARGIGHVIATLYQLTRQLESGQMEGDAGIRALRIVKSMTAQACQLQLLADGRLSDPLSFGADVDRLIQIMRSADTDILQ